MIVVFIVTVDCGAHAADTGKDKAYTLINIEKFNHEATKNFCKSFDYVVADVDVIFKDVSKITESDVEILKKWDRADKKLILYKTIMDVDTLYTNALAEKLQEFDYTKHLKIVTPVDALVWHLNKIDFSGKAYVIGDDDFIDFVKSLGIETISSPDKVSYSDYYTGYNATLNNKVKAVIIAFDLNINLYKMSQAIRYLSNPEVKLFLTHPKTIFLANYYKVWIKKLIADTKRTKLYIDQLDGVFGDFLVEENHLNNKVLTITTDASGNRNFTIKHKYKPLLIGDWKVKKEIDLEQTYYKVDHWTGLPWC
ncbi:uncharacterized protein [Chelonus insularis]|uniref:uncharacterized protein n=1 Tax=Chelonus insularis TaxID=460826 RepID=UPI00158B5FCF|nr:uncharacterized protein LOC118066337 [Chelonus insularis]